MLSGFILVHWLICLEAKTRSKVFLFRDDFRGWVVMKGSFCSRGVRLVFKMLSLNIRLNIPSCININNNIINYINITERMSLILCITENIIFKNLGKWNLPTKLFIIFKYLKLTLKLRNSRQRNFESDQGTSQIYCQPVAALFVEISLQ